MVEKRSIMEWKRECVPKVMLCERGFGDESRRFGGFFTSRREEFRWKVVLFYAKSISKKFSFSGNCVSRHLNDDFRHEQKRNYKIQKRTNKSRKRNFRLATPYWTTLFGPIFKNKVAYSNSHELIATQCLLIS